MSNVKKNNVIVLASNKDGYIAGPAKPEGGSESYNIKHISFSYRDAATEAESLIKHTIGKSHEIVDRAKFEAEAAVKKAKEQGYSKGYEESSRQGSEESLRRAFKEKQPFIDAISKLEAGLAQAYVEKSGNEEYIKYTLKLAKKIIYIKLAKDDETYFRLFEKAALHIGMTEKATLKMGPRGYAVAQAHREKFMGVIDALEQLEIILEGKDDGLCVLETPLGNIDASVEAQLDRVQKIILPQN